MQKSTSTTFKGFKQPEQNYSKLPHEFIDLLPDITALTEIKVLVYLLRHTWGYSEYDTLKRITIDEFVHGRKQKDGTRIDGGTGLSEQGVRDGIKKALDHEYITVEIDDSDRARVKKFYGLNILGLGVQDLGAGVQNLDPDPPNSIPRSEKETIERKSTAPKGDSANANGEKPKRVTAHYEHYLALLGCYGFDDKSVTKSVRTNYMGIAVQLHTIGLPVDSVPQLYAYVAKLAKDGEWKSWTVNTLEKYAPQFMATLRQTTAVKSTNGTNGNLQNSARLHGLVGEVIE